MARPVKKGLDYFPHDTDATSDDKLEALQSLFGNDGYAFYFKLLERIYHTGTGELDIADPEVVQILCRRYLLLSVERFHEILEAALKWGCFDAAVYRERQVLTSHGIRQRSAVVFAKRREMQELYEKNRAKPAALSPAAAPVCVPGVSDAETTPETGVSAAETTPLTGVSAEFHFMRESKVKENIPVVIGQDRDCRLTVDEVTRFTAAYTANIEPITPFIRRQIEDACRSYSFAEMLFAVQAAARANARRWSYVAGVLAKRQTGQPGPGPPARPRIDPDKYIRGQYGHMVHRF